MLVIFYETYRMKLKFYQNAKLTPNMIGLRNGAQTANAIIAANLGERESLGTHYLFEDAE